MRSSKNLVMELTREQFEALIRKYVDRSREIIEEALKRQEKEPDEISKVILVGGSTLSHGKTHGGRIY